jgi:hypothetical protein
LVILQRRVGLGVGNRFGKGLGQVTTLIVAVRQVMPACSANLAWNGLDVLTCGVEVVAVAANAAGTNTTRVAAVRSSVASVSKAVRVDPWVGGVGQVRAVGSGRVVVGVTEVRALASES